jgi:hypothetical protein
VRAHVLLNVRVNSFTRSEDESVSGVGASACFTQRASRTEPYLELERYSNYDLYFLLKSLRTLDCVRLTHFLAGNNLETLNLAMTTAVQNSTSGANSISRTLRLNPIAR